MYDHGLFCFEIHSGPFSKPISGSQRSDVIQALQPITCGSEKFKCRNLMSSSVSEPPRLCVSHPSLCPPTQPPSPHRHYHLPSSRNHISRLLVPLQAIKCQVTSAPAAGSCFSVPRCKFRAGFGKWAIMSTSADCTQIQTSWPARLIRSTAKSERKAKGILILFEKCSKCELQGFPFHLERLQQQNNHISLHT